MENLTVTEGNEGGGSSSEPQAGDNSGDFIAANEFQVTHLFMCELCTHTHTYWYMVCSEQFLGMSSEWSQSIRLNIQLVAHLRKDIYITGWISCSYTILIQHVVLFAQTTPARVNLLLRSSLKSQICCVANMR